MRSNKGISFQIILMIVAIAAGAVGLIIVATVSDEAVKSGDYSCLIGNSFKNMMGGDFQYDSGKGYCKTELKTIRVPDLSSATLFKDCKPMMSAPDHFDISVNYALENPDIFIQECLAYQVMDEVEECWANYLLGEAHFDGTCDRICFADGFSSYLMDSRDGTIILPKVAGSSIYFYPGEFDSNNLDTRAIRNLISLDSARQNYGMILRENQRIIENRIQIEYVKPLGIMYKYSIVQHIPADISTDYLSYAITVIEDNPERTGLNGAGFAIESSDDSLSTGEEWEIKYYEEENINALTVGGTLVGARIGGKKGAATLGSAGWIADSFFGTAVGYDGASVALNKRGVC